jgi:protein CWC15
LIAFFLSLDFIIIPLFYFDRTLLLIFLIFFRQPGQNTKEELVQRDFKRELEERERKILKTKHENEQLTKTDQPLLLEHKPKKEEEEKNIDADDSDSESESESESDDSDDDSESEDEAAELMRELEKIKKERAEEQARKV